MNEVENLVFEKIYWNNELNIKLLIKKKKIFNSRSDFKFYFKGQLVKNRIYNNRFGDLYDIGIDFYDLNARDCLTVNRDSWLESFIENFNSHIFNLIFDDVLAKKNGFELIDEDFFNFTNVVYGGNPNFISKLDFLTNSGVKNIKEIMGNNFFYITNEYLPKYDSVFDRFDIKFFLIIRNVDLLDALVKFITGFNCYRVEGFNVISVAGSVSIIFSKGEIEIKDTDNIFKINSIVDSLEYFLETKILNNCKYRFRHTNSTFPIGIPENIVPVRFSMFSNKGEVILPFFYSSDYIHFISYLDYCKLIDLALVNVINNSEYNDLINYFKEEILKISSVNFTGV